MKMKMIFLCMAVLFLATTPISAQEEMYAERRQNLMHSMSTHSSGNDFAVLFSQAAPGRFNKSFFYLTGIKDQDAALVLVPGGEVEEALFTRSGNWDYASQNASSRAYALDDLGTRLRVFSRGRSTAHVSFGNLEPLGEIGRIMSGVSTLENIDDLIAGLRIIKGVQEIEFLRMACQTTAEGLNDVFMAVEAGMQEEDLSVMLEFGFKMRKSPGYSFLQAASGPNATNVHFGAGERHIEDGDIIVFDVGAWWNDYTADISRTIPVSGEFTPEQREIYTVVLNSQKAAIRLMTPGARMSDVQQEAEDVLIEGLHDLGLVLDPGNEDQRRFFIAHGYYHFIGLDIHDVWSEFSRKTGERIYEPGMVMTMEPGLYFPEDRLEIALSRLGPDDTEFRGFLESIRPVFEKYINIGVRIEDDVLITADGNEVLTAGVPKEISDIEEMMRATGPLHGVIPIR